MVKQVIKQVTVTGADGSIDPAELISLAHTYPFLEFGILLSKSNAGNAPRFPNREWIDRLWEVKTPEMNLSAHLCGSWVREICSGEGSLLSDWIGQYLNMFKRIQINFHALPHQVYGHQFINLLKSFNVPIIFQLDGVNHPIFYQAVYSDVNCYALFDISGGAGVLPDSYPQPLGNYCGYAGGLSPDNLKEQLTKLSDVVGNVPIWIDAETHLRSNDDKQFDIDKVKRFAEIAKPFVIKPK